MDTQTLPPKPAFALSPWQLQVALDTHRFRVVDVGRRGGKTTLAAEEIKGKAIGSECRVAYIAPTYGQARDIIWLALQKELAAAIVRKDETRLELEVRNILGTTSLIQLRGWESIESLRGQKFHFIVVDEVAMMKNFTEKWQEVVIPTLTDTKGEVLFISTPKGFNFFYDLYNRELTDPSWKSFHFTTYDNPNIDPEEIEKLKAQLTPDRFAQEYMAEFHKTEGLVYKEFDRKKHLYDILPESDYYVTCVGVDFGFVHPCAILQIKINSNEEYFVENEYCKSGKTNDQIAEMTQFFKPNFVYPDPEAPEKIQVLEDKGLNVMEVVKGKGSVVAGIDRVRELFKQGRLKINQSNCPNLIQELETYSYDDSNPNGVSENPKKENDDCCDSLRYVVMMREKDGAFEDLQLISRPVTRNNIYDAY